MKAISSDSMDCNVLLLLISLTAIFIPVIYSNAKFRRTSRPPLPPGPTPWPIVGNLPEMLMNKPRYRWVHGIMKKLGTEIACIRLGNVHVIPVTSPEIAKEFLTKHDALFCNRPETVTTCAFSNGYLTTGVAPLGDQWKKMRKVLVSEILNTNKLRWQLDKRTEEADNLVRYIYNQCKDNSMEGTVVSVRTAAQLYSGGVMRKMIFGKRNFGEEKKDEGPGVEEQEHVDALFNMLQYVYAFNVSDYLPSFLKVFDLDGHMKITKNILSVLKKYEDPVVDERVQQWKDGTRKETLDFLDVFITLKDDNGKPLLSPDEIKAQITELLLATVDNPYNAAEWSMSHMLNEPELMKKSMKEIDRVVGKYRLVQESDIPNLQFVTACSREALRLHPVAPFNLPHVAIDDVNVAGYFIPKGSHVLLSRIGLGRNPRVWDEPHRYNPERHLTDGSIHLGLSEPDLKYISFTRGRRSCMGSTLGTVVTVMLLSRLLQGFEWSLPPNVDKIDMSEAVSLLMANPLHAMARPRLPAHLYGMESSCKV